MSDIVRLDGFSLRYPQAEAPAPRDLTLSIASGERVLLLGPSGSGKSSLALALAGVIPHGVPATLSGVCAVAGSDAGAAQPAALARKVAIVFQDPESQFCTLTVEDEVAFTLENRRVPPAEMGARIRSVLERVGLARHRATRLDRLSGGEKQKVACAAALAAEPELLIFDEATSNLDPAGARAMMRLIREFLEQDRSRTFLLIERRIDGCLDLVTRVLVLDRSGSLVADGAPREVFLDGADLLEREGIWEPAAARLARALRAGGKTPPITLDVAEMARLACEDRGSAGLIRAWASPARAALPAARSLEAAVELSSVRFRYPGPGGEILDDVSFRVCAGEIFAFVGPNGAGKTTIAQIVAGLLRPSTGEARLFGRLAAATRVREAARLCGLVFQNPEHQFVADTVAEELAFGLRRAGSQPSDTEKRVGELVRSLGLEGREGASPFDLSGGQKRRLSVAAMLTEERKLLILDEPTFGLDAGAARRIRDEILRLNRDGMTILLISHDMELVYEVSHRVAAVVSGRIARIGAPEDVLGDRGLLGRAELEPPPQVRALEALEALGRRLAAGKPV